MRQYHQGYLFESVEYLPNVTCRPAGAWNLLGTRRAINMPRRWRSGNRVRGARRCGSTAATKSGHYRLTGSVPI